MTRKKTKWKKLYRIAKLLYVETIHRDLISRYPRAEDYQLAPQALYIAEAKIARLAAPKKRFHKK